MSHDLYFSQAGEDFMLWKFFHLKPHGFYIDVGAFDGVHLSNTYFFERAGWKGICVEPNPEYFTLCRTARPNSICIHAACVQDEGIKEAEFSVESLGLLSGIEVDEDDIRRRYDGRGLEFSGLRRIRVPAITLNAILRDHLPSGTPIDFLSVDVEGTEIDVLRGLDLTRYRPRVIVAEANSDLARDNLSKYLVDENAYQEARTLGVNTFYAREDVEAKCLRKLRGCCRLEHTKHPLGDAFTLDVPETVSLGDTKWQTVKSYAQRIKMMISGR